MKLVNHTFKENTYTFVTKQNLNKKIVLISDIHFSEKFKKEKATLIINRIKSHKPDYICIPGDIIDSKNVLKDLTLKEFILDFIRELSNIAKTIISIGNHDNYYLLKKGFRCQFSYVINKEWFNEIKKIDNVIFLDNELYEEENLSFFGLTLSYMYYEDEINNEQLFIKELKDNISKLNKEKYNILLCHSPLYVLSKETIENSEVSNIDLILSGHMHNGVVPPILDSIIKGNKGIFSPDGSWLFKTKLTRGTYKIDDKTLIISGGITKIHDSSPNILIPFNELFPISMDIINLK